MRIYSSSQFPSELGLPLEKKHPDILQAEQEARRRLKREQKLEVTFRVASFRHDQETSVKYRKFKTLGGLLRHITHIVLDTEADYVSLRIIRSRIEKKEEG